MTTAARGAIGGSAGEVGSAHRAAAAAFIVVHGLLEEEVQGLLPQGGGAPVLVRLEVDEPTDDIYCECALGRRAWVQAKHELSVGADGKGLKPVIEQWASMIRDGRVEPGDGLVLAVRHLTGPLEVLRAALNRRRDPYSGAPTGEQQNALDLVRKQFFLAAPDLPTDAAERLLNHAVIWHVDAADAENILIGEPVLGRDAHLGAIRLRSLVEQPDAAARAMALLTVAARAYAARRSGGDMAAWRRALSNQGIRTTASPPGSRIEACDPLSLGVHRCIKLNNPHKSELPPYVEREHDSRLRDIVDGVIQGESRMATLVAGSSTGKTRACWEAVLYLNEQQPGRWRLWHPYSPTHVDAALEELDRVGPYSVVWLNEVRRYLAPTDPGAGERIAAGLRRLLNSPDRGPVLVLATAWREHWNDLVRQPSRDRPDLYSQARELLAETCIEVAEGFTVEQLATLRTRVEDARLRHAAERSDGGRVTQYLAAAPELENKYRLAEPQARAVVDVAIDARRLGHPSDIPRDLLEKAAHGYLDDHEWNRAPDDWLGEALRYASEECRGAVSLLTRIRPRHPAGRNDRPSYRLADHVEQIGSRERAFRFPPASFWESVADVVEDASLLFTIARHADNRGRYQRAIALYLRAVSKGSMRAVTQLVRLWERAEDAASAEAICIQFLDKADPDILYVLARMRDRGGDLGAAEALYRQAAEGGRGEAVEDLTDFLFRVGRRVEAEEFAAHAARLLKKTHGLVRMAQLLEKEGDLAGAEKFCRKAIGNGNSSALIRLARLRKKAGDLFAVEHLYRQAVDSGHTGVLVSLADLRERLGDFAGAEHLYQQAVEKGHYGAFANRARRHHQLNDHARAEQLARQAAKYGDLRTYDKLIRLRLRSGDRDGAERLCGQAAEYDQDWALTRLANIRAHDGDTAGAEKLTRQAIELGVPGAVERLAKLREGAHDPAAAYRIKRFGLDDSGRPATSLPRYLEF
ncbi:MULTISPECIES: tetratricopeptide repeat protein [Micromonospora]|uniref:tetratricopeptide repeat protein n=1 Tax=Micromonospora TaxID=1873 RepID=UPI0011CD875A|nr:MULTISPECIES: tetratricopeptide repeat protein [Micromonospora]NES17329.1 tetratricopeptide repeat protein [Micromonospora sp. PPF5-17B]NES39772.1 tetratricopeptide repeat protein [Micromonospora solifontis]NES59169.1 tetratricopeptide repeat protein [Micromonospora sp. PPF5-6]